MKPKSKLTSIINRHLDGIRYDTFAEDMQDLDLSSTQASYDKIAKRLREYEDACKEAIARLEQYRQENGIN